MLKEDKSQTKARFVFRISNLFRISSFGFRISTLLLSALLTGCLVGPDFHKPDRPMPAGWIGDTPTTAPTTQGSMTKPQPVDVSRWWQNFNDAELNSLIDRAIQSNLDLRLATSRILQARAQRGVVSSAFWPTATVNASYARQGTAGSNQQIVNNAGVVSTVSSASSRDLFQEGLDATWELDVFGGIRRDVEAANADIRAAVEDRRDVMVTLTSELALNYITLRGAQRELDIAQENVTAQEKSAEVTHRRQHGGFISGLDAANADAQVAATKSQIPVFQQEAQQTIYDIALLLGVEPEVLVKELTDTQPIPPTPPEIPIGLPSDLLKRRPDIRRAEAQLHAATARVGVATADLFPKFSITGAVGLSGPNGGSMFNWNNGFWSIGPNVSYDLFDAGRIRANIAVQNELTNQAALTYEQASSSPPCATSNPHSSPTPANSNTAPFSPKPSPPTRRPSIFRPPSTRKAKLISSTSSPPSVPSTPRRTPSSKATAPSRPTSSPSTKPSAAAGKIPRQQRNRRLSRPRNPTRSNKVMNDEIKIITHHSSLIISPSPLSPIPSPRAVQSPHHRPRLGRLQSPQHQSPHPHRSRRHPRVRRQLRDSPPPQQTARPAKPSSTGAPFRSMSPPISTSTPSQTTSTPTSPPSAPDMISPTR